MSRIVLFCALATFAPALPPVESLPTLLQTSLFVGWIAGTGSMAPYLCAGDYALCAKPGRPIVGDLVVYLYHGRRVIHEVIAVKGNRFRAKGLANLWDDGWMDCKVIEWRVVRIVRIRR